MNPKKFRLKKQGYIKKRLHKIEVIEMKIETIYIELAINTLLDNFSISLFLYA